MRSYIILVGVFLGIALLVFGVSLTFDFVSLDDGLLIYRNPTAQGFSLRNLWAAFTTYDPELYIPLTLLSYQLDYALGEVEPFLYHAQNLLWHIGNAVLVVFLIRKFLGSAGEAKSAELKAISYFCGLLFLVHPLNTETVVWASARKDVLSTFWFLLSLSLYVQCCDGISRNNRLYAWSIAAFALALMAKVSVITLPVVLVLLDYYRYRGEERILLRSLKGKIPYFILAGIFGIVAVIGKAGALGISFKALLLLGAKCTTFLFTKFLLPFHLSVFYPYTGEIALLDFALPLVGLLALISLALVAYKKNWRVLWFGLAFYLLTLAPSFFNLQKGNTVYIASDRYAYVPMIGLLLILGWLVHRLAASGKWSVVRAVLGIVLVATSLLSFVTARHWRDSYTLYSHVTTLYPNSFSAHLGLGNALRKRGDPAGALRAYAASEAIKPDRMTYYNSAIALEDLGQIDEATAVYRQAIEFSPDYAIVYVNLGRLLFAQGQKSEAEALFLQAQSLDPTLALAPYNLGFIAAERGEFQEALKYYAEALAIDPRFIDARANMAIALLRADQKEQAREQLRIMRKQDPSHQYIQQLQKLLR